MPKPTVYLALPAYGPVEPEMMMSVCEQVALAPARIIARTQSLSLLAFNFNALWCEALNARAQYGLTHFLMLHGDVAPHGEWLKTMLEEMEATGADILSAVVPLKDCRGLTTTALLDPRSQEIDRLDYDRLENLPPTFDGSHFPGKTLLVNTGLMLVDFTRPWVEEHCFTIRDRIVRNAAGLFEPKVMSEDWLFSEWAAARGLKVFATQKIGLTHWGKFGWSTEGGPTASAAKSASRIHNRRETADAELCHS